MRDNRESALGTREQRRAPVSYTHLDVYKRQGQPFGLAEIMVVPAKAEHLQQALEARGWRVLD